VAQEALGALIAELDLPEDRQAEAAQLLLSVIGLCWFPAVHAHTLLPALGIDPADAVFREDRRRHVVRLVVHALSHALSATPSTTASGIPADTRIG
jgi:hypothetical protein